MGIRYHTTGLWGGKHDSQHRQVPPSGHRRRHPAFSDSDHAGVVQTSSANMKHFGLFLSLALLAGNLAAQDTPSSFVLSVNSDLMELHVSVVDEKDRTVSGLLRENFKIMENGREQPISVFKHEDVPVSLGLVIDNSRSIEPRKTRLDAAVLSFVRQSNAEDETFVVHFDFDARMDRDFTSRLSEIETTLAASKPFGQTAIYDALMLSLEQ